MRLSFIVVGKNKEPFLSLANLYLKRLEHYFKLQVIELNIRHNSKDESLLNNLENQEILKQLAKNRGQIWACDPSGLLLSSEKLALEIDSLKNASLDLTILVGGSYGLNSEVLKKIHKKISFSKMVFPHLLFRVMLYEQIYRSATILNNEPYHK